eukprot:Lithocolla_globosa_v1_NODE_5373_length_1252_cov_11.275689.p1 type:complete len:392 gc:universal NODE_5373_length_1252_cov_11.275689:1194-19(-)
MLKGLRYMHEKDVIHRDIKGVNILLTKSGEVRLGGIENYGMTKTPLARENQESSQSPYWMAPELFQREASKVTTKADIWSVGCLLVELFTGSPPYKNLAPMMAIMKLMRDPHPPLPPNLSEECNDFLLSCFKKNVDDRADVDVLLDHPWIKKFVSEDQLKASSSQSSTSMVGDVSRESLAVSEFEGSGEKYEVKIYFETSSEDARFVTMYASDVTPTKAIIELCISKLELEDPPKSFYLAEVYDEGEELRFHDYGLPAKNREPVDLLGGEEAAFRLILRRCGGKTKEGFLMRKRKTWVKEYFILNAAERYFAFYDTQPKNPDYDLATGVIYNLRDIETVEIDVLSTNSFKIIHCFRRNPLFLQASSKEEMVSWVNSLRWLSQCDFTVNALG